MTDSWHHSDTLLRQLDEQARLLGFSKIGITDPDVSAHTGFLDHWLAQGFEATMDWFHRHLELRRDPTALQPGTRRVISVALDYLPENTDCIEVLNNPDVAYISRYALGRDYHKLLRKRLKHLADWLGDTVGEHGYRVFTDSAPILEKHLAEKAGLGWIGKHTLLLSRSAGSWFFLGEILTDCPLPLTEHRERPKCGSCTACLDICPTQAFPAPYQLDANRCISYLTIEHAGVIPEEFRASMGNRVFGCDDCQLVCPWNRYAQIGDPAFTPRHGLDQRPLLELFLWDEATFLESTEGSPIRRAGYVKFLENLAIGLGNGSARSEVIAALNQRLGEFGDVLDTHIDWALKQLNQRPSASDGSA